MDNIFAADLADREAIKACLAQYCRGVDRGDAELIRDVYHPDATDDHGGFKGLGVDFADYVVERFEGRSQALMHNLHQSNIDLNGDKAWVETYFTAHHRRLEDGAVVLDHFGGRYVDRFERRDKAWRIADRTVVYEWSKIERPDETYPHDAFTQGTRNRNDLSYRR